MKQLLILLILPVLHLQLIHGNDDKLFDDSVLYNLEWDDVESDYFNKNPYITVVSSHQESYDCYLPDLPTKGGYDPDVGYEGPSALEMLSPLWFPKIPCSYRLETYWTYEVCHGRYIRQYHENREGKTFKLQEYILGKWDKALVDTYTTEAREYEMKNKDEPAPTKKIDGVSLPYLEVTMGNGTLCEVTNKPRKTTLIYVCYMHGKNEVYSHKETAICQYEIIILTPLLCDHPKYKPADTGEHKISCVAAKDSPKKPYNLRKMKVESRKHRRSPDLDQIHVEFLSINEREEKPVEVLTNTSPVQSFLSGKKCLNGGTGWWKYEFCYGRSIEQYHMEKDGSRTSINLGLFDKQKHLDWLVKNPSKRPAKQAKDRNMLIHLYSGGSVCDRTGKARQTEVKLKCMKNTNSVNTVSLYLLEPKYCEYILGVESPLICDILARADDNGLVPAEEESLLDDLI